MKEARVLTAVSNVNDLHTGRVRIESESIFPNDEISANIDSLSDIDGIKAGSYEYQWYRNGAEISGETGATIMILSDWGGDLISVEVMFEDEFGNRNISHSVVREVYESTDLKVITELLYAEENYAGTIGMVEVSGQGDGTTLSYSIGDTRFNINEEGEVYLNNEQNFETTESNLKFMVTVSDGGILSIREVEVEVENVNEAPTFILTGELIFEIEENATNTAELSMWDLSAFDEDRGALVLYTVSDDTNFGISESGQLYLKLEQNYETFGITDKFLVVTVTADDGGLKNTKGVKVNISDVNDSPVFNLPSYTFSIDENITSGGVANWEVTASDEDRHTLTYSIDDEYNFTINASSGELYLWQEQNYEGLGGDKFLIVTVTASDGQTTDDGQPEINSVVTQEVRVNITDVNEAPQFTLAIIEFNIEENKVSEVDMPLGTVTASDEDGDTLGYSVSDGTNFSINVATGALYLIEEQDYESLGADKTLRVTITATDGEPLTGEKVITINIEDVNDSPVFDINSLTHTIDEGTSTVQVVATDEDTESANNSLTYSIATTGNDNALFSINVNNGELSFINVPDYETARDSGGDNVYEVLVTVSDGVAPEVNEIVTITVSDVNDNTPEITSTSYMIEEGTSTVQVLAIDDDGTVSHNSLTFSISTTGNDNGEFSISTDGLLTFTTVPDYEMARDADTNNVYEVLVTVSDGAVGTDDVSAVVMVTVEDVNDNTPEFTSTSYMIEEGTSTVQVLAIDDDGTVSHNSLTFSISTTGNDNGEFSISTDGLLTFTTVPDYEMARDADTNNVYEVLVTVSDGAVGTDDVSAVVMVTVEDVNDNNPEFTSTSYMIEEGTSTVQVLAIDDDGTVAYNSLTFSISTTGNDNGEFSISTGGVLTFTTVPDYEMARDADTNNVYEVLVTVSDGAVGTDDVSAVVMVTVEDVNDNTPEFTSTSYMIEEGTSTVQVLAIDDDGTVSHNSLTFSISTTGNDNGEFSISTDGLLTFTTVPDYEMARDADGDNIYEVLVTVSDGVAGTGDVSAVVMVTVEDVNDNTPEITSTSYMVDEGTSTVQIMARDEDGTVSHNSLTYSMGGVDVALFDIASSTGILSFKTTPDYEMARDADGDNIYEVLVTVSDGFAGTVDVSAVVMVTVSDVNDNAPVFTETSYSVDERVSVVQILVTDADGTVAHNTLTYSMAEAGNDNALFSIDTDTGELSFKTAPDYENPADTFAVGGAMAGDNVYVVLLTVTDGSPPIIQTVEITVNDTNDNAPVFTRTNYMVDEGISTVQILAEDVDGTIAYSLGTGGDSALFSINSGTGVLAFSNAPDYESAGDGDGDNTYEVVVTANDGDNPVVETVLITVNDVNDNAPAFTETSYNVDEGISIVQILARDADGTVAYNTLTYSMSETGNGNDKFTISSNGILTFKAVPDYEVAADTFAEDGAVAGDNIYEVLLTVSDGDAETSDASATVLITVNDVNDNTPEFYLTTLRHNVNEGETAVGQVSGRDADGTVEHNTLTYSMSETGNDNALFSIVSVTGFLSFKTAPDYENAEDADGDNIYEVLVTVSDGDGGADGTVDVSAIVMVTVEDVNDNVPEFTSISYVVNEGTSMVQILARDADGEEHNSLTFSISTGGADDALFSISTDGVLTFTTVPDYESPMDSFQSPETVGDNIYEVLVTASDGANEIIRTVMVRVADVNDNKPEITEMSYSVDEGTSTVQIMAIDEDSTVAYNSLTYSISTTGNDNGEFSISTDGLLTFTTTPDYEMARDADTNNVYEVLVTVSDGAVGTNDISATVMVTVGDVNDNAPEITEMSYSVDEGTSTVQIMAIDEDGTVAYNSLTYSISTTGNDNGEFSISTDGLLTFTTTPDYEMARDADTNNVYEVLVTVSDGAVGTNDISATVMVTVEDVNDNAPEITEMSYMVNEGTTTVQILARDEDGTVEHNSLTFSISTGGVDDALFRINAEGELRFITTPDYEQALDDDRNNIYEVLVTVSDGDDPSVGTPDVSAIVMVSVGDVNDNEPEITGMNYMVNEGTSTVQIVAEDGDISPAYNSLTFSISTTGNDNVLFSISEGGELSFIAAPDYEMARDGDRNNIYEVLVTVSDGVSGTEDTSATVMVTVEDVNDSTPQIIQTDYGVDEQIQTIQIIADDEDGTSANNNLTYSLSGTGNDNDLFSIDADTGILSFNSIPDYENPGSTDGNNIYEVLVTVSDGVAGTNDVSATLMITVEDIDDNFEVDEGTAEVSTIPNARSISPLYDHASFSVDESSGLLSFRAMPDFENPGSTDDDNVYVVEVVIFIGSATVNRVVMVTVEDVNDNAPAFTETSYMINEGTSAVQMLAEDADITAAYNSLTYSLSETEKDNNLFSIASDTGILSFKTVPDYENPSDTFAEDGATAGDNVYVVVVTVSDGVDGTADVIQTVMISVADANDNAPIFDSSTLMHSVDEGLTAVGTVSATDADGAVTYSLGTTGNDNALFIIDGSTGLLSFRVAPDYESPMDSFQSPETVGDNIYEVLVTASDGSTPVVGTVMVTVDDVNESPVLGSTTVPRLSLDENEDGAIVSLMASDPEGGAVSYSVSGSDFMISAQGELRVKAGGLDYESLTGGMNETAIVEVVVTISDDQADSEDITESFMVTISDVNESPLLESTTTRQLVFDENTGGAIVSLMASDPEGGAVSYSVSGSDFVISAQGELSLNAEGLDYESLMGGMNGTAVVEVVVTISDGQSGSDDLLESFMVTINDVNDNAPEFTEMSYNVDEGTSTVQIMAEDDDATAAYNSLTYSMVGTGNDNDKFTISTSGLLTFNAVPDYENPADTFAEDGATAGDNVYVVVVTVSDGADGTADVIQTVMISVEDANDNAPIFDSSTLMHSVDEGLTAVGTVSATDADGAVTYSLGGERDNALFSIDGSTGELSFKSIPDYESPMDSFQSPETVGDNIYEVLVTASDGSTPVVGTVMVTVTDVNDNAPEFTEMSYNVDEGTSTVQIMAIDEDGTVAYNSLTYSISTTGNDNGEFSISTDGLLTFTTTPDYEMARDADTNNVYEVLVTVSDGATGTNDVSQTVMVTVEDANDNTPMFAASSLMHTVTEGTTSVGTVSATDGDGTTANNSLTYSIAMTGNDNALFMIEADTGALSFKSGNTPDFEIPSDTFAMDGATAMDNVYEVLVTVSDGAAGTNDVSQTVMVTVTDANDNTPMFTSPTSYTVEENTVAVGQVSATDDDGTAAHNSLTYSIAMTGNDNALFSITTDGELSFKLAPDYETPSDTFAGGSAVAMDNVYEVLVTVSDGIAGTNDVSQTVMVTVTDANDNTPMFTSPTSYTVEENTVAVGQVSATDDDGTAAHNSLTYSIAMTGNDNALFNIAADTGALSFKLAPDYESPSDTFAGGSAVAMDNVYEVLVTVSDGIAGTNDVSQTVMVTVTDVNDNTPMFTASTLMHTVTEGTTAVGTVSATDGDGDSLAYSMAATSAGKDNDKFSITAAGVLSFKSGNIPDYETPGDVGGNNVYEVVVTVSDGNNVTATVMVTVEDVENRYEAGATAAIVGTVDGEEDIFVFDDASSSLSAYTISDFLSSSGDKIDLSGLSDVSGITVPATGTAITDFSSTTEDVYVNNSGSDSIVYVNTDTDDDINITITVLGVDLSNTDFIL